jgi:hypothetical protein
MSNVAPYANAPYDPVILARAMPKPRGTTSLDPYPLQGIE